MKKITLQPGEWPRYVPALGAGLLLAASFPKFGVAGLAWIGPGLLLAAALGHGGGAAFRLGFAGGLAQHLVSLYWLLLIPIELPAQTNGFEAALYHCGPALGWLALSAYLAVYRGLWVWVCWKVYPAPIRLGGSGDPHGWAPLDSFLATTWRQRLGWGLFCAALWVAGEMLLARFLSGFPWNFLGVSQHRMLPLIQMASFTGVYGVSFLIVWFSVSLGATAAVLIRQPAKRRVWLGELILPMLCAAGAAGWGMRQVFQTPPAGATLNIALVQPSIPQTLIWSGTDNLTCFGKLIKLSGKAVASRPDLVLWPEAAVPGFARWDTNIAPVIQAFARTNRVWLILGADDLAAKERPGHAEDYEYYNASFLVSPAGEFVARYIKRKLVIFGEYVPLADWLPFLKYLTPIQGGFTPGRRPVSFPLPGLRAKTSVLICFEDIFPHLVREHVDDDTDFLVNLTNNGWFGESAAQWQHAANAVFRAVENGLPLVRCANNGLTCWVDARGRVEEIYFPGTRDIYGAGWKMARVPLLAGQPRAPTFYRRHGDWFGWSCVAVSALGLGAAGLRRRA